MARMVSRESVSRKLTFDDVNTHTLYLAKGQGIGHWRPPRHFSSGDEPIPSGPKLLSTSTCRVERMANLLV